MTIDVQSIKYISDRKLKCNSRSTVPALVIGFCVHILLVMFEESLKLLNSCIVISIGDLLSK